MTLPANDGNFSGNLSVCLCMHCCHWCWTVRIMHVFGAGGWFNAGLMCCAGGTNFDSQFQVSLANKP
jgi:serine acetyltransferase